jgi:hypothetical protein
MPGKKTVERYRPNLRRPPKYRADCSDFYRKTGVGSCIVHHHTPKPIDHCTGTTNNASAGLTAGGAITNFFCDGLNPVEEKNGVTFRDGEVTSSSVRQTSRLIANCA